MRRIVNFRAPLFVAIGLVLGIFSFYEFLFGDFWFGVITLIVLFAIGVLLFVLKSKTWVGVIAVIVSVVIGFFLSQLNYFSRTKDEVTERNTIVTGRVTDILRNGTDSPAYYLEDCVDENGVKYKGRIQTYIFDGAYKTGDVLTIRGTIRSVYPIKEPMEAYYFRSDIRFEMDTDFVILREDGRMKLDETVRKYIFDTSVEYAPKNGDVLYALLTGDRDAMDREKLNDFKVAGIIHLLAVSGLHVGFVVAVLGFLIKRFKLHPLIECGVMLIPLLFYAYICNFTPSVIRAIVMVVCTYLARAVFGRYDLLTSLSFAVIVILLIFPFNLFDLGFQLSVLSVFGIATVYSSVNQRLKIRNIPKLLRYFVNSLVLSLSCSLATFFTLQLNYGYAPVLGIVLNIVVIPLVTVAFVVGWLGMLPWLFHFVLWAVDWLFEAVVIMAKWVANLSFATASVPAIALTTVVVVVWLFVLGGYVNLRKVGKVIVNSILAAVLILCIGLSFVKVNSKTQAYVTYGYSDTMCVVTSDDGNAAIIGNFDDLYAYAMSVQYLSRYKINSCVLYITDYGTCNYAIIEDAIESLPLKSVYKLSFEHNSSLDGLFGDYGVDVFQQMENSSTGESIVVTSVYDGGLRAITMQSGNLTVASVYGDEFAVANYLNLGIYSDVYVLPRANKAYSDYHFTTLSKYQSTLPYNYGANKYGNFTIAQKDDTIVIKFR